MMPKRRFFVLAVVVALSAVLPAAARADQEFGPTVSPLGPEEVVKAWDCGTGGPTTCGGYAACNADEYNEEPVHAYRFTDEDGVERVAMLWGRNSWSRRMVGNTLDTLQPEQLLPAPRTRSCGTNRIYIRHNYTDPSRYEHWEYIGSGYVEDGLGGFPGSPTQGRKVYGILHEEFHPNSTTPAPNTCTSSAGIPACWMSATTTVTSTDGGRCFGNISVSAGACNWGDQTTRPDASLIAALPDRFQDNWGYRGTGNPSNVVYDPDHGYFYAVVHIHGGDTPSTCSAEPLYANCWDSQSESQPAYRDQQPGLCLIRTRNIADPTSWRAWDGTASTAWDSGGFTRSFVNPYNDSSPPSAHRCQPVAFDTIGGGGIGALSFNTYFNKYMYVGHLYYLDPNGPDGFYYTLSSDLIHWSKQQLIFTGIDPNQPDNVSCQVYPSLIDPGDPAANTSASNPSRNFNHPGRTPYIYFRDTCVSKAIVRRRISFNLSPSDPATQPITRKEFTKGARINFQPFGSKLPDFGATYSKNGLREGESVNTHVNRIDAGDAFEGARGYGWVRDDSLSLPSDSHVPLDLTANTRDRHSPTWDQEHDTLIYMHAPSGTSAECSGLNTAHGAFEMNVPNGRYLVLAAVGDAAFDPGSPDPCNNSVHHLTAEGVGMMPPFQPSATQPFFNSYVVVTVNDGRLTIRDTGTNTKLDWIDISPT